MSSQNAKYSLWSAGVTLLLMCSLRAGADASLAYRVAGVVVAGAVYLLSVAAGRRARVTVAAVFVLGLLMRFVLILTPPLPNPQDDYYRYLWDGSVAAQGLNPYRYSPDEAIEAASQRAGRDPRLVAAARPAREILPRINQPQLTTIYPPVAQVGFAAAYQLQPFSATSLRIVFLSFDLATFVLLVRLLRRLGLSPGLSLVYWWNPVALNWIYGEVHMDVMVFPFVMLAILFTLSSRPVLTGASLAVAVGVKLWPVALLPVLAWRWHGKWREMLAASLSCVILSFLLLSPMVFAHSNAAAGLWTYAETWENNAGLYSLLESALALWMSTVDAALLARLITAALLLAWIVVVLRKQRETPQALLRACLVVTAAIFLLSPAQFPWYYTWTLPFLVFWLARALLAYTVLLPLYYFVEAHPWIVWLEHAPFWLVLALDWRRSRRHAPPVAARPTADPVAPGESTPRVAVVIPALNEERSIGRVLSAIPKWVSQVVVADNGSTDRTAAVAKAAGPQVVSEPQRGYGAACLAGIAALDKPDIVVFLDGDFSDDPSEMSRLVAPVREGKADLVIGSRNLGECEPGALSVQQRFGNALACWLIRLFWGQRYTDLGPFRAIRFKALQQLEMDDRTYGWTVQMQLRAVRFGLSIMEVPVSYRRRVGDSKISGTVRGAICAGTKILSLILLEKFWRPRKAHGLRERVIVFARYPVPGKTKTRLIEHLGKDGAAAIQDSMTRHTLGQVAQVVTTRGIEAEVRFTGGEKEWMVNEYGQHWTYTNQGEGDLGCRLARAVRDAFDAGVSRVILIGTDCPALTPADVTSAFNALHEHDLVIGPATDGGYYLLGLRKPCLEVFRGIDWGTAAVLHQTMEASEKLHLSIHLLRPLRDVDRPEDLPVCEVISGAGARAASAVGFAGQVEVAPIGKTPRNG